MMDRSEFLKLLSATPFAFKSLLTEHSKEHIEKYSKDVQTVKAINQQGLVLKNKEGELIAHTSVLSVSSSYSIDSDHHGFPYARQTEVEVEFNKMAIPETEKRKLQEAFRKNELVQGEIYDPDNGQFMEFEALFMELITEHKPFRSPNSISGSLLVRGTFSITQVN